MTATATEYYNRTAASYDALHAHEHEHIRALEIGLPLIAGIKSVLDVGCGTGTGLSWIARENPAIELHGIEPSKAMLDIARQQLPSAHLQIGSGENISYENRAIDLVLATGIMHHVDSPSQVISEMFRVAAKAVLISDHNNYAFGGAMAQRVRMGLKLCGLLGAFTYVKQGFNKRGYSKEDGWWYPYSLFDNYAEIARRSSRTFIVPTGPATGKLNNLIYAQSHFCIIALKDN